MATYDNGWYEMNGKLQKKKNSLRSILAQKGMLKREGNNTFDKYSYFSEAQYKMLFNQLFSQVGLELKFSEVAYDMFEGTEKQANGRTARLEFQLIDIDTGFFESSTITGEGIDKGDKAGYKAYTGALKYYLADTFMVATGDDPEKESPEYNMNRRETATRRATRPNKAPQDSIAYISLNATEIEKQAILRTYNVQRLEDLSDDQVQKSIMAINKRKAEQNHAV